MSWERIISAVERSGLYICNTDSGRVVSLHVLPPESGTAPTTLKDAEIVRDSLKLDELFFEIGDKETASLGSEYSVMLQAVPQGFPIYVRVGNGGFEAVFGFEMEERGVRNE